MSEPPQASPKHVVKSLAETMETCFVRTAEALKRAGAASDRDILKGLTIVREDRMNDKPADLIETMARVLGHEEERMSAAITSLSDAVASTMVSPPPVIPFASKLIAPSSFYESFDFIHKLAKAMLVPIIYADDTDAIGTGSINPITASILGEEVLAAVDRRFDIRPFITVVRMDYESWAFICRKHFEL